MIIRTLFVLVAILSMSGANNINIDAMCVEAKKSHKHVLVFLHRPGCSYCNTMIEFTLPDEKIVQKIKKSFILVDIDIKDPGEVIYDDFKGSKHEFAKTFGYDFYPNSIFIDKNKEIVYEQAGYQDEESFLNILRFVESYSYENMDIEDFK